MCEGGRPMSVTSEWLSRKLGYGFSYDEDLPQPEKWIEAARAQVAAIPKFDPWRLVAKNPKGANFTELQLPDSVTALGNYNLSTEDLRYPDSITRAVSHFKEKNRERERLGKLLKRGLISESDFDRFGHKRFNRFPWWRDTLTRGLDNSFGETSVFNRFWHFWINHFSLNIDNCEGELFGSYYLTLRSNLTKKFEDLLFDAIWHPAMQIFLSNNESVGPNSKTAQILRDEGSSDPKSINENLARELLELYTVTPDAKYTQEDVNNAAYILTGWGSIGASEHSSRYFVINKHQPGFHKVLGITYDNTNPEGRLQDLCRNLARHPLTAKHIAKKLAKHFISDEPPEESIKEIEKAFVKTGGLLSAVHQAVIDQVVYSGPSYKKFLSPEIWFWQLHRSTKKSLWLDFVAKEPHEGSDQINSRLYELGQLHSKAPQPNGWPDSEVDWVTPEYFDRRVRYSYYVGYNLFNKPDPDTGLVSKFDPKLFIERLAEPNDDVIKLVKRAESYPISIAVLFCSYQFLRA